MICFLISQDGPAAVTSEPRDLSSTGSLFVSMETHGGGHGSAPFSLFLLSLLHLFSDTRVLHKINHKRIINIYLAIHIGTCPASFKIVRHLLRILNII